MTDNRVEVQEITSALALRAFAHPLRIRLIDALAIAGSATATDLSEVVGESPANCSWHLRQLAKYGFIEPAPGGTGRQRPWRVVVGPRGWNASDDAELRMAGDAAADAILEHEVRELRTWRAGQQTEPDPWREAAAFSQSMDWLTADELAALNQELFEVFTRHLDRVRDPARRPAGSRPIRMVAWAFPAAPITGGAPTDPTDPLSADASTGGDDDA